MKWFGRKSGGAPALPSLARAPFAHVFAPFPGGDWPRGYEAQVRSGYESNPVAQRAVRIVAEGVGGAPLSGHARAVKLVQAASAGQGLAETMAAHLMLHGNAYVRIVRGGDGTPCELYALRPDRIAIEADSRGWPEAFVYRVGDVAERMEATSADGLAHVVHIKGFHPLDDHYGLGCLGAAAMAVGAHNAAAKWNRALLDNAARPSGALVYDPGEAGAALSPEQYARLKAEMVEAFQGAANAGRPMLLEGGLNWQAMSLSPADMDFAGLKAAAARDIALAFGVPPMLLGLPGDNTYANYREASRALWRLTLLPLAAKMFGALEQGLQGWWPDAAIAVDMDRISALSEDRERLWAQVSGADFLSADEKRKILGLNV